jgi:glycosyltransferase involved in cell wall biosynthesis
VSGASELSVVVPARDAAVTIRAALRSVLDRADGLLEVIVIDDASVDETAAIAAAMDPRVRVIAGRGIGPAAARNAGVRAARGTLIGFLDADDEWLATAPDQRRLVLARSPFGGAIAVGPTVVCREGVDTAPALLRTLGEVLVPRALALAHPLNESLRRGEDLEWFLRVADAGVEVIVTPEPVARYHRRPGSLSQDAGVGLLAGLAATIRRRSERSV